MRVAAFMALVTVAGCVAGEDSPSLPIAANSPVSSNSMSAYFGPFTLGAGQSLSWGGMTLSMQSQGNLVLYGPGGGVLWASGSGGPGGQDCGGGCVASFQPEGNLVLYQGATPYWLTSTASQSGYLLKLTHVYPYIAVVDANHLTTWNPSTGPIAPSIDMGEVVSAFALRHPGMIKKLTTYEYAGLQPDPYHTEVLSPEGYVISRFEVPGAPAGNTRWVDDQMVIADTWVGYAGTNIFVPWGFVLRWDPAIRLSNRYINVSQVGTTAPTPPFTTFVGTLTSPAKSVQSTNNTGYAMVLDSFGALNFGGNIGSRWYVRFAQVAVNTVTPTSGTDELNTLDLGPSPGVYDPEYGWLAYGQINPGGHEGATIFENFGDMQPGSPSGQYFNDYTYGPGPATVGTFPAFKLYAGQTKTVGGLSLVMQPQGNLILYRGSEALWASGSAGPDGTDCGGACFAAFQADGNLVLYSPTLGAYWSSGASAPSHQLRIQDTYPYLSIMDPPSYVFDWSGIVR